jgi:hypothetical protein
MDSAQTLATAGAFLFCPLRRLVLKSMGIHSLPVRRPLVNDAHWPWSWASVSIEAPYPRWNKDTEDSLAISSLPVEGTHPEHVL